MRRRPLFFGRVRVFFNQCISFTVEEKRKTEKTHEATCPPSVESFKLFKHALGITLALGRGD